MWVQVPSEAWRVCVLQIGRNYYSANLTSQDAIQQATTTLFNFLGETQQWKDRWEDTLTKRVKSSSFHWHCRVITVHMMLTSSYRKKASRFRRLLLWSARNQRLSMPNKLSVKKCKWAGESISVSVSVHSSCDNDNLCSSRDFPPFLGNLLGKVPPLCACLCHRSSDTK